MSKLPKYIGPAAFGVKMGVIVPGTDVVAEVCSAVELCHKDGLIDDGDVLCVTESVVARAECNFVGVDDIARQVKEKLQLSARGKVGVLFPILSRNRFSMVLKGIARAVPEGEVVVQLSFPNDEVGNALMPRNYSEHIDREELSCGVLWPEKLGEMSFVHPITGVDYVSLYREIIESEGARSKICFCNNPRQVAEFELDGVIVSDIHTRFETRSTILPLVSSAITLQDLCSDKKDSAWSEWGLLGSNMSADERLKLAPREAGKVAEETQERIRQKMGKNVEVIIYGDGAYRDPTSGIYELADPRPAFGATKGLNRLREGFKYKYLADKYFASGNSPEEIEKMLDARRKDSYGRNDMETEGTTPRRMEDVLASLADLVSGSADAGTPLVVVKGFLD